MLKLQAVDLNKSYRGQEKSSMIWTSEIGEGEVVSLLGLTVQGKPLLFISSSGLAKPDSGRVLLKRRRYNADLPMYLLRARGGISYLPQEPSVFRQLTVEQNLLAVLETLPPLQEQQRDRLRGAIGTDGIANRVDLTGFSLDTLSGEANAVGWRLRARWCLSRRFCS